MTNLEFCVDHGPIMKDSCVSTINSLNICLIMSLHVCLQLSFRSVNGKLLLMPTFSLTSRHFLSERYFSLEAHIDQTDQ